jgi:hypothetical protein
MAAGRVKKVSAEWFKHDANASMDHKIMMLEMQFGLTGYALYFKIIEYLTRSDNYEIEWDDMVCLALSRHFGCQADELNRFIVAATNPKVAALSLVDNLLYSSGLKKRMDTLQEKRDKDAERQRIDRLIVAATTERELDLLQLQYELSQRQKELSASQRDRVRVRVRERGEIEGTGAGSAENPPPPETENPGLYSSIFYDIAMMKKSNYWNKVRELTCMWSGKSPTNDSQLLSTAMHKYNLWLIEKREWTKGITPQQFAAGLSKWVMNEKQTA